MKLAFYPLRVMSHFLILSLVFNPALSMAADLAITPDGTTNTQVTKTGSGIDQINIAAPNSSGMSHNKFTDYNVNKTGQVINNFSGVNGGVVAGSGANAVTSSNIGGLVIANSNLRKAGKQASIIMNEVTSTNNSQILGYTEIVGGKAQLLIVNPNGITCNGCGFINTSRMAMVAGRSDVNTAGDISFNLNGEQNGSSVGQGIPLITIEGLGLDVTRTDYTDIIASSVKLIAGVYGGDDTQVNIKAGDNRYDYQTGDVTSYEAQDEHEQELFAIDASNLGTVNAGRIFLVATKDGLGVNMGGTLYANQEMNIDAKGNIYYTTVATQDSGSDINMKTDASIIATDQNAIVQALGEGSNINIQAGQQVSNVGDISANQVIINADAGITNLGSIIALQDSGLVSMHSDSGDIVNLGSVISYGDIEFETHSGNIKNASYIVSVGDIGFNSAVGDVINDSNGSIGSLNILNQDKTVTALLTQSLIIKSEKFSNYGTVKSNNFDIYAKQSFLNEGFIDAKTNSDISTSGRIENYGSIQSQQNLTVRSFADNNLVRGVVNDATIFASGDLIIHSEEGDIENNGTISSASKIEVVNESGDIINSGSLSALGQMYLRAEGEVLNNNHILSVGYLEINADNVSNSSDDDIAIIQSTQNSLQFNVANQISNAGEISAHQNLTIAPLNILNNAGSIFLNNSDVTTDVTLSVTHLINSGLLASRNNLEISAHDVSNLGQISSTQNLTVNTKDISNGGDILSGDNINLVAVNDINNMSSGIVQAENHVTLTANNIDNYGTILGVNRFDITAYGYISNQGILQSALLNIANSGAVINAGLLRGEESLVIDSSSLHNTLSGVIYASTVSENADEEEYFLRIATGDSFVNAGQIQAARLEVIARSLSQDYAFNNAGTIYGQEKIVLDSDRVNNTGIIKSDTQLDVINTHILHNNGTIYSDKSLTIGALLALENVTNAGLIASSNNLTLNADDISNSGALTAEANLVIKANNLSNAGDILSGVDLAIIATNRFDNLTLAEVQAGGDLSLKAKMTHNQSNIFAENSANISADDALRNEGNIQSTTINIVNTGNVVNLGLLKANNNIAINSTSLDNQLNGVIYAAYNDNFENGDPYSLNITSQSIHNAGHIQALSLALTSSDDNSDWIENAGTLYVTDTALISGGNINNSGDIISNENLTINVHAINNSGTLASDNHFLINADDITNSGVLVSASNLDMTISNQVSNALSGKIQADNQLHLNASTIDNKGSIFAVNTVDVNANADIHNEGIIQSNILDLFAKSTFTNSGFMRADEALSIESFTFSNALNAIIYASYEGQFTNDDDYSLTIITHESLSNLGHIESKRMAIYANDLQASTSIDNTGIILADEALLLSASNVNNSGTIHSYSNAQYSNVNVLTNSGSIGATSTLNIGEDGYLEKFINSGSVLSNDVLSIASDKIDNSGSIIGGNNLSLNTDDLFNSGSITSDSFFTIYANQINNSGALLSGKNLDFVVLNTLENTLLGQIQSAELLNITTGEFDNQGNVLGVNKADITTHTSLKNTGIIQSSILDIKSQTIENSNLLRGDEKLIITSQDLSNDTDGVIYASYEGDFENDVSQSLYITTTNSFHNSGYIQGVRTKIVTSSLTELYALNNTGTIFAEDSLQLNLDSLHNTGLVSANNAVEANIQTILNEGSIAATNALTLLSLNISNAGSLSSDNMLAIDSFSLSNAGLIAAGEAITINANDITNSGGVLSDGKTTLTAMETIDNILVGDIQAADELLMTAQSINNEGDILGVKQVNINTQSSFNNAGNVQSNSLGIESQSVVNSGLLRAELALSIHTAMLTNNVEGIIYSAYDGEFEDDAHSLYITTSNSFHNAGHIQGFKTQITTSTLSAIYGLENTGSIFAEDTLSLNADSMDNTGLVSSSNVLEVMADHLFNSGSIAAVSAMSITSSDVNNLGSLSSGAAVNVDVLDISNAGSISSGGNIAINANNISNAGDIVSSENSVFTASNVIHNLALGEIQAGDALTLKAQSINNEGDILAVNQLDVATQSSFYNAGNIQSNILTIASLDEVINSGLLRVDETLTIETANLSNSSDGIIYAANDEPLENEARSLKIITTNSFSNAGHIQGLNAQISASSLTQIYALENSGTVFAGDSLVFNLDAINNAGLISSGNVLEVNVNDALNSGSITAASSLVIHALNMSNSGFFSSGDLLEIDVLELSNNSSIISGGSLLINANNISNSGDILSEGAATLIANNTIDNEALAEIQAGDALILTADFINNEGNILGINQLDVTAQASFHNVGNAQSNILTIATLENITNLGLLRAEKFLSIETANLSNSSDGIIYAAYDGELEDDAYSLEIATTNTFNNAGHIQGLKTHISASSLPKMYALENSGTIFSSDRLAMHLDTIDNSGLLSSDNIVELTVNDVVNSGSIAATNSLVISSLDLRNTGLVSSGDALEISTSDINNLGFITSGGNLAIEANNITNSGSLLSEKITTLITNNTIDNEALAEIQAGDALILTADSINNEGNILGINQLNINAQTSFYNAGNVQSNILEINSLDNVTNLGLLRSDGTLNIETANLINSFDGVIYVANDQSSVDEADSLEIITTNSFNNAGHIQGLRAKIVTSSEAELYSLNNSGTIFADDTLLLDAKDISNAGFISSGNIVRMDAEDIVNVGSIAAIGSLSILSSNIDNSGFLSSSNIMDIDASDLTNEGIITSGGNITINANNISNSGSLLSEGTSTLIASNTIDNEALAEIQAGDALILTADSINNEGNILGLNHLDVTAQTSFLNAGNVQSNILTIASLDDVTNFGLLRADEILTIETAGLINSSDGIIYAANDEPLENEARSLEIITTNSFSNAGHIQGFNTQISASSLSQIYALENSGTVFAGGSLALHLDAIDNSGLVSSGNVLEANVNDVLNSGSIAAASSLAIHALNINNSGFFSSEDLLEIDVLELSNNSSITSGGSLLISANNISNSGDILSGGDTNFSIIDTLNNASTGNIQAAFNLGLTADIVNNAGDMLGVSSLQSISQTGLYNEGSIQSNALNLSSFGDISNSGLLRSEGILTIQTVNLINGSEGIIYSAYDGGLEDETNTLVITTTDSFNNAGYIEGLRTKIVASSGIELYLLHNSGTIFADDALLLDVDDISNAGFISSGNILQMDVEDIVNIGSIAATGALSIVSSNIDNEGLLSSSNVMDIDALDVMNEGVITAGGNIAIDAQSIMNAGSVLSVGNISLSAVNNIDNTAFGDIQSEANITLEANNIDNQNSILSLSSVNIIAYESINNEGIVQSNILDIISLGNITNSHLLKADESLIIDSSSLNNDLNGIIYASGEGIVDDDRYSLNITTTNVLENAGHIQGLKVAIVGADEIQNTGVILSENTLLVSAINNLNNSGIIQSDNSATYQNISLLNNNGAIVAINSLNMMGESDDYLLDVKNAGTIIAGGSANISLTGNFENTGNIEVVNGTLHVSGDISNAGLLQAANDLLIAANNVLNVEDVGVIQAGNNVTITANKLDNLHQIFSQHNLNIELNQSLTNAGVIQSLNNMDISAATISNFHSLVSNNDLIIETSGAVNNAHLIQAQFDLQIDAGSLSNASQILSNNDLIFNISSQFTNSGILQSGRDISASALQFYNEGNLQAANNITFATKDLTNVSDMIAQNEIYVNRLKDDAGDDIAGGTFTNQGLVQAANYLSIEVDMLVNNSTSSLILSSGMLKVAVHALDNSNSNSGNNNVVSAGIASIGGDVQIAADIINNNSGLIRGKNVLATTSENESIDLSNIAGTLLATQAIDLEIGESDYVITGDIIGADYVNIKVGGDITNLGDVMTTGYIKLESGGSIINGYSDGVTSNDNVQLLAGSYLHLIAGEGIDNYASLSSNTDLTLTVIDGDVTNHSDAKIIGGEGETVINAQKGRLHNLTSSSEIMGNDNLTVHVQNLENYGGIYAKNDMVLNVSSDLSNYSTALIWAGNNLTANVGNDLNNIDATIYAINNLILQKSDDEGDLVNTMNALNNISGDILSYQGDVTIKADTINNERLLSVVDLELRLSNESGWEEDWIMIDKWCYGHECENDVTDYFASVSDNTSSKAATINSGQDLFIYGSKLNNDVSEIFSSNDMIIEVDELVNSSQTHIVGNVVYRKKENKYSLISPMFKHRTWEGVGFNYYKPEGFTYKSNYTGRYHEPESVVGIMPGFEYKSFTSEIKSGGSMSISANTTINNGDVQNTLNNGITSVDIQNRSTSYQAVDTATLATKGFIEVNLSSILGYEESSSQVQDANKDVSSGMSFKDFSSQVQGVDKDVSSRVDFKDFSSQTQGANKDVLGVAFKEFSSQAQGVDKDVSDVAFKEFSSQVQGVDKDLSNSVAFKDFSSESTNLAFNPSKKLQYEENGVETISGKQVNGSLVFTGVSASNIGKAKQVSDKVEVENMIDKTITVNSIKEQALHATEIEHNHTNTDQLETAIITKETIAKDNIIVDKINTSAGKESINIQDSTTASVVIANEEVQSSGTISYSGLYKIDTNTTSTAPLIESRSPFTNTDIFYGSDYFYAALGISREEIIAAATLAQRATNYEKNAQQTVRILGDSFVESQLLSDQLISLRSDALLLSDDETDANEEVKTLIDNAVLEKERLGLTLSEGLTDEQVALLEKDIVWFETMKVNGQTVIAPKIYLTLNTRNKLLGTDFSSDQVADALLGNTTLTIKSSNLTKGSLASNATIFAGSDLNINAPDATLFNSGSIISGGGNVNISAGTVYNVTAGISKAKIKAIGTGLVDIGNVNIVSVNDVVNLGADIGAVNALNITSLKGNIINSSIVQTNDLALLNLNESLMGTAAQGLGISAYQNNVHDVARLSGNISSSLLRTGSLSGGSINIDAANDFKNLAANISTIKSSLGDGNVTSGNLFISAGDDITIDTLQLRNRTERRWGHASNGGIEIKDKTVNIGSNINLEGSLIFNANNDALIKGSNVNVGGDATINTLGDLNIVSAIDSNYEYAASYKRGSFGRSSSSLSTKSSTTNIESNLNVGGDIHSNSQKNINIIASNLTSGGDIKLEAALAINLIAGQDIKYEKNTSNKTGITIIKTSNDIAYDLKNVHTDLTAGGDIALNSGTDANLIGTNLIAGNNIDINAGEEVMIAAVADESYRYSDISKTRSMATVAKYSGISAYLKTADFFTEGVKLVTSPFTAAGLNSVVPIASGMVNYSQNLAEGDLNSKSSSSVTKIKTYQLSKLNAANNLNITSNNNVDLIGTDIDAVDAEISSTFGDVNISNVKDTHYSKNTVHKSKTTINSLATDAVKNVLLAASTVVNEMNMWQHPDTKKQTKEENEEAMGQKSQKQYTHINSETDETVIASTIDVTNLTINSGRGTIITSSDINTANNLNINSTDNTIITSDVENDSSFSLTEKKNPNIIAAFSNGIVKVVGDAMPDFSLSKPDKKKQAEKEERENDSLGHDPHSQDISVATNTDNAMINGYTISNNDPSELAYDTDLDKRTVKTKTHIASNINSQNDINIDAIEGNNTIIAANLTAVNNINISALKGQTLISSATNESFVATSEVDQEYNDVSLNYNRGRLSLDARTAVYEEDNKATTNTQLSSNLTSGNDINIISKDDINILSSNLNSDNEINLISTEGNTNIGANKNTQHSETEIREGTLTLSAGVGHVAVDAAYAVDDAVKAAEGLKDAKQALSSMKKLYKEGKATKTAVDDAETNLVVASLNVLLAGLKAASAAEKVKGTAHTLGFYADLQLTRTGDKTNIVSDSSQEVASNLLSGGDLNIASGVLLSDAGLGDVGNTNIQGNVQSINGDINITSFNDTNIVATKNESSSSTKSEGFTQTVSLGASYGESATEKLINSLTAQISKRSSESDSSNVDYINTNVIAGNGTITINSVANDTNIRGANVLAENVVINSGNDLNVESLQNKARSKSKSQSVGGGGGNGSVSLSYNASRSSFERDWVDDQTQIIANDSLIINTQNNTDVKGAVIASNIDNLLINTGTLTYSDIIDREKQESSSFGISTNISKGKNAKNPAAENQGQDKAYFPAGSTSLSLSNEGYEKEQVTRATIGEGTINIVDAVNQIQDIAVLNRDLSKSQEVTKDVITGALNVSTTIDNRLFTKDGREQIVTEVSNLPENILLTGLSLANGALQAVNTVVVGSKTLYNEIGLILTPEQKVELDGLMVSGRTVDVVKKIEEQLGHEIDSETKQKVIKFVDKQIGGNAFLASLTPEERTELVQKDAYGLHFDGTDNNGERDVKTGEESNIFRLKDLFNGLKLYVTGVGSDYDKEIGPSTGNQYELATGAGAESKEQEMMDKVAKKYQKSVDNGKNQPFVIADVIGFSRGAATARNFANLLTNLGVTSGNETVLMPEQIILRSVVAFDTVSSFGASWNTIDWGKDFRTSTDAIVIHPTAEDEKRLNFSLQSIKPSADSPIPDNWVEYAFPGAHSDVGGSYKEKDAALYVMNWVISQVNEKAGDTVYNTPSQSQMPSVELTNLIDNYLGARDSGNTALATEYKHTLYQKGYIHDSTNQDEWPHKSFGPRKINYPNVELKEDFRLLLQ